MSAGLPVVASDFPLWRQIIGEAKCGLLVNPTDIHQITEAILWLLSNSEKAEEMGQNGQRAVLKRFNWESGLTN